LDGADSSTVILNGSTVSQWTDKSAAGNNATQPTAGNQPSYSASGIVFAGNQWLITPIGVNPTAESFFIVFKTTNNLAEIFSGTNANGREVLIVSGVMYLSKYGTNPVGLTPNGGSVPTNTVTLFDYQYTTSLVTLNLNGLQAGSGTPAVSYSGTGTSYIGSSTYAANNMYGTIYEIIYYNVSLTTNQFQQVEGYLAWKWGIQANLPANHPYKNSSPSTTNPGGVSRPANLPVPPITIYAGPRPPTYVTSGLLFYLDAGNATSYPGSGSTWTDLAGSGLTTTLYNSPTYSSANGGYLAFAPGSSQYGQTSASLATLSSWSLEVWHYYTATNTGSLPCIITEVWSSTPINFTLGSGSGSTSSLQVGYYNNGWFTTTGSYSLPSVGWYHIVGTYDGANLKLYVNNVLTQTSASTTASVSSALGIRFMRRWDSPEYWGGYLAIIRIYNRALSATEVTTNYAASKARFGLS
jgi:hypothetical protein